MEDEKTKLWHQEERPQLPKGSSVLHSQGLDEPTLQIQGRNPHLQMDFPSPPPKPCLGSKHCSPKPLCLPPTTPAEHPRQQHLNPLAGKG